MKFSFNNSANTQVDYAGIHSVIQSNTVGAEQGNLLFTTISSGSLSEKMRIDGAGYVGIGTTTPQSNLQIGSQTSGATGAPATLSLGGTFSNLAGAYLKLKLYDDGISANTYGIGVSGSPGL